MEKKSGKNSDVFDREHAFLEELFRVVEEPPDTKETFLAHCERFIKGYTKLLRTTEKLTRLADTSQNKLMRMKDELEEASITDPLTGLRNRRFLTSFLEKDTENIMRAYKDGPPTDSRNLFFMIVDIDFFKQVNDNYGHGAGDLVLQRLAELISGNCRKGDIPVRWGGEEFLVVYRDADREFGSRLAERLRCAVEQERFQLDCGHVIQITCSTGFAFFPFFPHYPTHLSWEEVVNLADRGLYTAKENGRNAWVGVESLGGNPDLLPSPKESSFLSQMLAMGNLNVLSSLTQAFTLS